MSDKAEDAISDFYDSVGWKTENEITEDARRWEDLREHAASYVHKCRLRVLKHIPDTGLNMLDMASGPIQYDEYLEYSKNYQKRYCVDLSSTALKYAEEKIGDHGVFLNGSFFDIPFEDNFFDCSISLHTIYHIHMSKQEEAVRKLLRVTKPGKPVIIVYSNPDTVTRLPSLLANKIQSLARKPALQPQAEEKLEFYFHAFPIQWWDRFSDIATIKVLPWRSFTATTQKTLFPDNKFGSKLFNLLYWLEDHFPQFFSKNLTYPMIILTKKSARK